MSTLKHLFIFWVLVPVIFVLASIGVIIAAGLDWYIERKYNK